MRRAAIGIIFAALCALTFAARSEDAFFSELPVVLTVARLQQPLRDAPGSVTVIDRETIKRMGARDLADVLRWVPGFQVAQGANGVNAPFAVYHGLAGTVPNKMQVLIDGRSQYTPLWWGGVNFNVLPVNLEDIERIEILRGSNSAAYGSNAMLGVINVITTDPALARGGAVSINSGNQGVGDIYARVGWGATAMRSGCRFPDNTTMALPATTTRAARSVPSGRAVSTQPAAMNCV